MKFKIIALVISLLFSVVFLSGCFDDEHPSGLTGIESDFYGIWVQKDEVGGFGIGDTYEIKSDKSCEIYWSHGGVIHYYGFWDVSINETNKAYFLKITINEKDTVYYYDFFDNYTTLRLREENSDTFVYFYKE